MVRVGQISSKKTWEHFVVSANLPFAPFFQSWNWGEVQRAIGNMVFRFGLFQRGKLVGICQVVEIRARRGAYFHLRHGPIIPNFKTHFNPFLTYCKAFAVSRNVDFIRTSPLFAEEELTVSFFRKLGFRNAPIYNMDAENTWVLDLQQNEEEILSGMRKTTRYLVKRAQTMPISIVSSTKRGDFKKFMQLYEETSRRHGFSPHRNIREEFMIFTKDNQAKVLLARYKRRLLAGALIVFYGNQAVYHHGASSDEHKDIPASYLLQWEAIKEAKRQKKKLYNFWGVVPSEKPNHPWQGLSLFKTGFGGSRLNFIHAQDLPLSLWYWKTYLIESTTKLLKGY